MSIGWDCKNNCKIPTSALSTAKVVEELSELNMNISGGAGRSPAFSVIPTPLELDDLSSASQRLWELDFNRLNPGTDYAINVQTGHSVYDRRDTAREPLFTFVDSRVLKKPTIKAFIDLLDNYIADTGVAEVVSKDELKENRVFLNAIMDTFCMQYCHNYLSSKNLVPRDRGEFIRILNELWFGLYRREASGDSSAFEHVFLGEIRDDAVLGMHNWVQMYNEERKGTFNYMGYIAPKRIPKSGGVHIPAPEQQLLTLQFEWKGFLKPASTSFIGIYIVCTIT